MSYSRFAIYFVPDDGALAKFGSSWLGWDIMHGRTEAQPDLPGLNDITVTPRKYGFHGTLKPPFRLAADQSYDTLVRAVEHLALTLAPARADGLEVTSLGGFLALTPTGDMQDLSRVAEACVISLDIFRAPATETELLRRRKANLSPRQEALLSQWGYPYVIDQFRFHLTLSGRLPDEELKGWTDKLKGHLPDLPTPFVIDQIALCGERQDGRFEVIHRYTLAG